MAKKVPEQKLADLAAEVGFERLDSMFRLLRALNTPKKDRKNERLKARALEAVSKPG